MGHNALHRCKLWTMACESLFQIVAASFAPDEITCLCQKHQIALPQASHGTIALYHLTHRQCHRDAPFVRQIQRDLTRRYATAIARLNACPPAEARQMVEAMLRADSPTLPAEIAGIIWAVASEPRPAMRAVEQALVEELHLLSHCLLLAQWRGEIMAVGAAQSAARARSATCEHTLAQLRAERQALQTSLTHLQQQTATLDLRPADEGTRQPARYRAPATMPDQMHSVHEACAAGRGEHPADAQLHTFAGGCR